jgi:hypothetical protein
MAQGSKTREHFVPVQHNLVPIQRWHLRILHRYKHFHIFKYHKGSLYELVHHLCMYRFISLLHLKIVLLSTQFILPICSLLQNTLHTNFQWENSENRFVKTQSIHIFLFIIFFKALKLSLLSICKIDLIRVQDWLEITYVMVNCD